MPLNLKRTENPIDRIEREGINNNWSKIENNFNDLVNTVSGDAFNKVVNEAKLIWQNPVNTFSDLSTTYPTPEIGWASQTLNDGNIYRYDGTIWDRILQIDAGPINAVDTRLTEQILDIATDIQNQNQLISAINRNMNYTINIGRNIDITASLIIPNRIKLKFNNGARLRIRSGVTLTLNCYIDAGYYQIFEFEDNTANVTTNSNLGLGYANTVPSEIQQEIIVDWFGANSKVLPTPRFQYSDTTINLLDGQDSTVAFKRAFKFAEDACYKYYSDELQNAQPSIVIKCKNNASYYVIGNNPCGIQSNVINTYYNIAVDFNNSTVIWRPESQNNVFMDKYGRMLHPNVKDLHLIPYYPNTITQLWGTFVASKTNQGDAFHFWTKGVFENIFISPRGLNYVFDIGHDVNESHDDLTSLRNVNCLNYNTFLRIQNREAVNWRIEGTSFQSFQNNGIGIDIIDGFSGGLTLESCEILMTASNETFLRMGANISPTPIRINNSRIETRNSNAFTLVDAKSGNVMIDGLRFDAGNSGNLPNAATRSFKVGKDAFIRVIDSLLYDKIDVEVSTASSPRYNALHFDNCQFFGSLEGGARVLGHPSINYRNATAALTIGQVIKGGYRLRNIIVDNPAYVEGGVTLPITYGTHGATPIKFTSEVFKLKVDGNHCLNIPQAMSLPPNIVVTGFKLFLTAVNPDLVNAINVTFRSQDLNVAFASVFRDLTNTNDMLGVSLLGENEIVSLPNRCRILVLQTGPSGTVTNENNMPNGWFEIEYRALNKRSDLGSNDSVPTKKALLQTF